MKLLTIQKETKQTLGVKTNGKIIDVEEALKSHPKENVSADIMDIINGGEEAVSNLRSYINELPESQALLAAEATLDWGPAVTKPNKIICVGLNYKKHADE